MDTKWLFSLMRRLGPPGSSRKQLEPEGPKLSLPGLPRPRHQHVSSQSGFVSLKKMENPSEALIMSCLARGGLPDT